MQISVRRTNSPSSRIRVDTSGPRCLEDIYAYNVVGLGDIRSPPDTHSPTNSLCHCSRVPCRSCPLWLGKYFSHSVCCSALLQLQLAQMSALFYLTLCVYYIAPFSCGSEEMRDGGMGMATLQHDSATWIEFSWNLRCLRSSRPYFSLSYSVRIGNFTVFFPRSLHTSPPSVFTDEARGVENVSTVNACN